MQMMSTMEMYVNDERTKSYFNRERYIKTLKEDYRREGKLEGAQLTTIKTARNMLAKDMSIKDISDVTGLSVNEIEKLNSD